MASKDIHPEDLGEFVIESKLQRSNKRKEQMKEGVDFGKIEGKTSEFLWVGGAAKLAEEFGLNATLKEINEESFGEGCKITIILDIVESDGKVVGTGVGTWDNGEILGNMKGARQRGLAMAYKRAYVLGIRYATNSFGIFSQDDDVVRYADEPQQQSEWKPNQIQEQPKRQYDPDAPFTPCKEDENGVWRVVIGGKEGTPWAEYKGKELIDVVKNDVGWANWVLARPNLDSACREAIENAATGKL